MRPLLYWHTLRYLKWTQLTARVARRWTTLDLEPKATQRLRARLAPLGIDAWRVRALDGNDCFTFLNETRRVSPGGDWNNPGFPKLWLYNLHYFDWINTLPAHAGTVRDCDAGWMMRWIAENLPARGNGWEPYPLSLRIVNWIKWLARQPVSDAAALTAILRSIELQTHVLSQRLETHLLGNHLFENAKALIFAGCFFEGALADAWMERGARILDAELDEQILVDGGYFELSPMYHSIILEDVLDLLSLQQAYPGRRWREYGVGSERLEAIAGSMFGWLSRMTHPDGQIALLNDAALGIAPNLAVLLGYAERVGLPVQPPARAEGVQAMSASGFIRVDRGPSSVILDVARIGPDYLPGHAHADTLTFEWSLGDQRVVVDTGTSVYGESPERQRQRGTAAHNTVVVDGQDSSEVWRGFRVARRAYPRDVTINVSKEPWVVRAAHDGYRRLRGRVIHRRRWEFAVDSLLVADRLEGEYKSAQARFHFHPHIQIASCDSRAGRLSGPACALKYVVSRGEPRIEDSTYHPEFGCSVPNKCLVVDLEHGEAVVTFDFAA